VPKAAPKANTQRRRPEGQQQRFFELHESFLKRAKEGPVGLLFLGDSITEGWKKAPLVLGQYYAKTTPPTSYRRRDRNRARPLAHRQRRAGHHQAEGHRAHDRHQQHGQQLGRPDRRADKKIVQELRAKLPDSKVCFGVFPRGPRKGSDARATTASSA
jgi:beta-glucosidase